MIANSKILIIAAHPDDEVLGCGGMISKFSDENEIKVIFLTDGLSSRDANKKKIEQRKKQSLKVSKLLNQLDLLKKLLKLKAIKVCQFVGLS